MSDMCDTCGVGNEHHFVFVCLALAAALFAPDSRTLGVFVWQPNLLMVGQYMDHCFQVRAQVLNPCVGV
jgi:hypothetical protein